MLSSGNSSANLSELLHYAPFLNLFVLEPTINHIINGTKCGSKSTKAKIRNNKESQYTDNKPPKDASRANTQNIA
jgi:hypothetical protein